LLLVSCAQVRTPTGGPKDLVPPLALASEPANYSTNFNAQRIVLNFNEFIKLNDASGIIISPPLKYKPDFRVKQKSLIIIIRDTLMDSTTYSINLGDAISDITENNKLENFKYVFSTGSYVDSLKISGSVKGSYSLEGVEGVFVMLYPHHEDSVPMKEKPYYFSKTDEQGKFEIENIKEGRYKLFALKDNNFNYLYDLPNEEIAYSDSIIKVDSISRRYEMLLFDEEDSIAQGILNVKEKMMARTVISFVNPLESLTLAPLSGFVNDDIYKVELNKSKDTAWVYFKSTELDTIEFSVAEGDSVLDTVEVLLKSVPKDTVLKKRKVVIEHNMIPQFDITSQVSLGLSQPIGKLDTDFYQLLEDTTFKLVESSWQWKDSIKRSIEISFDWKQEMNYTLVIPDSTIWDVYGVTNDSLRYGFKIKSKSEYGNILLTLKPDSNITRYDYIVKIVNKDNVPRETIVKQTDKLQVNYLLLPPTSYTIKVIEDVNGNGKWDTGNYLDGKQPERVFKYSGEIDLKANWDLELDLKIK